MKEAKPKTKTKSDFIQKNKELTCLIDHVPRDFKYFLVKLKKTGK